MSGNRNEQVARILRITQLFLSNRSGYTIKDIHQRLCDEGFDCQERTVYRDIEALEKVHYPLVKDGNTFKLKSDAKVSVNLEFSYPELLALFITRQSLGTLNESPFKDAIDSMFNKIESAIGKGVVELANELNPFFSFHLSPSWGAPVPDEVMTTIEKGCAEGQALKIEYRTPSSDPGWTYVDLKIGPEYVVFAHHGAYLYGKKLDTNEFKLFAFPRIRTAVLLDELYEAELQGDEKIHKDSFGVLTSGEVDAVEIEISEPMASYVAERKWHASQQVIRTEKGIKFILEVRINDELARWVLGLGPSAKVKAPLSLQKRIKDLAQEISQKIG